VFIFGIAVLARPHLGVYSGFRNLLTIGGGPSSWSTGYGGLGAAFGLPVFIGDVRCLAGILGSLIGVLGGRGGGSDGL